MKREANVAGRTIYYEYDEHQDAVFVTFQKDVGSTYYEELEQDVLARRDSETNRVVGYTLRNIILKACQHFLPQEAPGDPQARGGWIGQYRPRKPERE